MPTPIKGVKRINAIIVCSNQRARSAQYNPYTMDVDQENKNCYICREFSHLARNCRNKKIGNKIRENRRLEYGQRLRVEGNNRQNNLNREKDLVVLI